LRETRRINEPKGGVKPLRGAPLDRASPGAGRVLPGYGHMDRLGASDNRRLGSTASCRRNNA
jgi:hypothetical protein